MNIRKAFITLVLLITFAILLPSARAGVYDQATKLTFNQPVKIPGRILPAGTYWFVLANTPGSRNIVNIYGSDRSTLYATILTINTESLTIGNEIIVTFAEREPMQPETLVSWRYPGESSGHQFVYPVREQRALARVKHRTETAMAQKKSKAVVGD